MRSSRNVDLSIGCITLFLLPFAGVGLFTAVMAVQRLAAGKWTEALFFGLFALTFGGVGIGGIAAAVAGRRTLQTQEALQASHPESPWLWRADWASGHITDSSRSTMIGAWLFAALWNLIGWPAGFLSARAALNEGKPAALLGLLFPLVGVGLVVWAIQGRAAIGDTACPVWNSLPSRGSSAGVSLAWCGHHPGFRRLKALT
jgi:hypothetical protein